MALLHRLEMRQGQSLVMTPQLLQAIKLLQLSSLDLVAYVEAELERNPLLERAEGEGGQSVAVSDGEGPGEAFDGAEQEHDWSEEGAGDGLSDDFAVAEVSPVEASAAQWSETIQPERADIEERFGAELDEVFPDEASAKPATQAGPAEERLSFTAGSVSARRCHRWRKPQS